MRVLLPDEPHFREMAEYGVPGVELAYYTAEDVPDIDAEGVVLWLTPAALRDRLLSLPGLRWVLTLTAGIDHVRGALPEYVQLYNASRLHDRAVAVHALAGMLAASRGLHLWRDAQARGEWRGPRAKTTAMGTLEGAKVVLWGYGHIGHALEDLLRPLRAEVTGVRRDTPHEQRDAALAEADWVILLLPRTPETRGLLNAERLSLLKPGAWVGNFGRGDLVVTDDLVQALREGHLGGAVLDVTDPEPLPAEHPLWTMENVILTPHVASSTADLPRRAARLTREFLLTKQQGHEPDGLVMPGRTY